MTFVMLTMGSAVLAFLGFVMEALGRECGINVEVWRIILYVCAALMIAAGIIDGIIELIQIISKKRSVGRSVHPSVTTQGLYPPPKRGGRAKPPALPPKRPTAGKKK